MAARHERSVISHAPTALRITSYLRHSAPANRSHTTSLNYNTPGACCCCCWW